MIVGYMEFHPLRYVQIERLFLIPQKEVAKLFSFCVDEQVLVVSI